MSFLEQTNEDFIKLQIRSLLKKPAHKRLLKRKLRQIGLYNPKIGFSTYKNFIDIELNNRRAHSMNGRYSSTPYSGPSKFDGPLLPKIKHQNHKNIVGILNTQFFNRNRLTISSCVLYKLTSKINIKTGNSVEYKDKSTQNRDFSEIDSEFLNFYLSFFVDVSKNITLALNDGAMPLPAELSRLIAWTYNEMSKTNTSNVKKIKILTKDTRLLTFFDTKPWASILSESIYKFYYKKYSVLGEMNFENFIGSYLLTHNLNNMQRLCFEVYDRSNSQCIRPSDLFVFFESPFFPLIKNDLFVMINYLSNYKYSDKTLIRKKTTKYFQELTENKNKKISFRIFTKLKFEQKFPDMLLAIIHVILGESAVKYICGYYLIQKYKVTTNPLLSLSRPVNYCRDFCMSALDHYKYLKQNSSSYLSNGIDSQGDLFKGALVGFILLCDSEAFCEYRVLAASPSSMTRGSEILFGRKCSEIIKRWYLHILLPHAQHVSLQEYMNYIIGFFSVLSI